MTKLPAHWRSGINLGNSLDAFKPGLGGLDTETSWNNPRIPMTTQELYQPAATAAGGRRSAE